LTITGADQAAYSSGSIDMTVPGLGGIKINGRAGGTGVDRYDDMMPTAWEETNGTSLGTGLVTVAGVGTAMNIEYSVDAGLLPDGLSLRAAIAPGAVAATTVNDKGVSGDNGGVGGGYDITAGYTGISGLNLFAGRSSIEQDDGTTSTYSGNRTQYVWGATYAVGSVTVGYQQTRDNLAVKDAGAVTSHYDNTAYGVAFNVNDNLSISYGMHKSDRVMQNVSSVEVKAESLQLSYTMGGMSLKVAESKVDNGSYTSGSGQDRDGTTIALTLAF
jgi:hypothetical protein